MKLIHIAIFYVAFIYLCLHSLHYGYTKLNGVHLAIHNFMKYEYMSKIITQTLSALLHLKTILYLITLLYSFNRFLIRREHLQVIW